MGERSDMPFGPLFDLPTELNDQIAATLVDSSYFSLSFGGDSGDDWVLTNPTTEAALVSHKLKTVIYNERRKIVPLVVVHYSGPKPMGLTGYSPVLPINPAELYRVLTLRTTTAVAEFHVTVNNSEYPAAQHDYQQSRLAPLHMVGHWFDLLSTRQDKGWNTTVHAGAIYSIMARELLDTNQPVSLRRMVKTRLDDLVARIHGPDTTLEWIQPLGPAGGTLATIAKFAQVRGPWSALGRDCFIRYLRTQNHRYAFDTGGMLQYGENTTLAPHARFCLDVVRFAQEIQSSGSTATLRTACYGPIARTACFAGFSTEVISYATSYDGGWFPDNGFCDVAPCLCELLNALDLAWTTPEAPAFLDGEDWVWHACRWLIAVRHGLQYQTDPDLDTLVSFLMRLHKVIIAFASSAPQPAKKHARTIAASVIQDARTLAAEATNPSANAGGDTYGMELMDTLSSAIDPFLVSGAGQKAVPFIEMVQPDSSVWMAVAEFEAEVLWDTLTHPTDHRTDPQRVEMRAKLTGR